MRLFSNKLGDGPRGFRERSLVVLKRLRTIFNSPFRMVGKSAKWLAGQAANWWKDRRLKNLLFGLPALALMGVCFYFLVGHRANSNFERAGKYLNAGNAAFEKEDWKTAGLFLARAIEMGADNMEARFKLAQAAENNNDLPRKVAILEELAPDDGLGYAPAHLWKAFRELGDGKPTAAQLKSAETHLARTLELDPRNRIAHSVLGDIQFQKGQWESAAQHLLASAPTVGRNSLQLAKALLITERKPEAVVHAQIAERQARAELLKDPTDKKARIVLAETLTLLEKFDDAHKAVLQGIELDPEDRSLRVQLARVYLLWAEKIREDPGDRRVLEFQAFQLLSAAAEQDPENFLVFDRMMAILMGSDVDQEAGRQLLLTNISNGIAAGMSHLVLGTLIQGGSEPEKAEFHLDRAFELLNNAPIVANNLAWHLCHRPEPNLGQALALIERVLTEHPDVPAFRETRGQILTKLEKYAAALQDLEFALPHFRNDLQLHRALTEVYEHLEITELAKEHRKIAKMLGKPAE